MSTTSKITPPVYAKRLGVAYAKVMNWIRSGELRAVNIATKRTDRPRWVIDEEDITEFENSRAAAPARQNRKRRRAPLMVPEYY